MFTIKPNLVQPHHFTKVPFLIQEFEGNLRTYLHFKRGRQEQQPIRIGLWKSLVVRLLA